MSVLDVPPEVLEVVDQIKAPQVASSRPAWTDVAVAFEATLDALAELNPEAQRRVLKAVAILLGLERP